MEPTIIGVDIAKQVFQLHWIARKRPRVDVLAAESAG
ncbi:hypothetical protein LBM341_03611 (plasmid) [Ralstonia solanacearum]|nr:hypothetical protein LBM341_03611 [Ralstonia solanacearum]NKA51317.1 IS110 family transposase [Ralstonia solanacearum]